MLVHGLLMREWRVRTLRWVAFVVTALITPVHVLVRWRVQTPRWVARIVALLIATVQVLVLLFAVKIKVPLQ
jgi:hypothetical protein